MARALVSGIMQQLGSFIASESKLTASVKEEIQKLESKFRTIQAVLNDAEKRQVKEEAVKLWLDKLKDVSYEMDDVLDEWNTDKIKAAIPKEEEEGEAETSTAKKRKVLPLIPNFSILHNRDIAHKIKELNEKLDAIVTERVRYGFELTTRGNAPEVVERPQTTCFVDVSEICGRDKVKDDLVSILLEKSNEEERCPHVISLVGMGGIGKTTLSQLAYNDPEVQAHFDIKMWVCVSDPFDQCRVAKAIIEALKGDHHNITELQSLVTKICELIGGKMFFLVLDDVWTEDPKKWEPFSNAFKTLEGSQSSRILVTTRKIRVAKIMGSTSTRMINLEVLSEEDCWLVFSKIAFSDKDPEQCEQLENLGRQIAKKCKGLPLAAKTLGSLMRFKRSREQWENVLDSNLWELEDVEKVVEKDLFAPLLLSYYDLPSPLKQCFSYCAVYPKDYVFSSDELVEMWMAQGFINSKENMEIIAREYFENLAMRSLFQDFEKDEDDGQIQGCKMHDIVHDFAQLMTKNECFTINRDTKLGLDYKNARHLFLKRSKTSQFPVSIFKAKNLRTLILNVSCDYKLFASFQHFRCLRSLTLNGQSKYMFENFIHLRYLNLRSYKASKLPKTIYHLCNLQILKIGFWGNFKVIPHGIGKLLNLRHFILESRGADLFNLEYPRGFGRLTSLRRLSHFYVSGTQDGCKLGELKDLNQLQGSLDIRGLENVVDVCEAENAQLKEKIHLHTLNLQFTREFGNDRRIKNDVSVLNALESPPNLKDLTIWGYDGTTMSPNWTMSLTKLKTLCLEGFWNLEHLPPLGKLPVLESLRITCFDSLRKVGVEFLGIESENKKEDNMQIFPNLKSLEFRKLYAWKEWIGIGGKREEEEDSNITIMPRLQRLVIQDCSKLNSLPDFLRTIPLKELEINCHSILGARLQRGTGEERRMISHIPNIKIDGKYVQRDGQEVKPEMYLNWFDLRVLRYHERKLAKEEFDKEASSSTMNLHD